MNTGRDANRLSSGLVVAADVAVGAAERFLALRPRTVALAGGSTPRRLYERLARYYYPWSETEVFFGDERCVPPNHPASNYRMDTGQLEACVTAGMVTETELERSGVLTRSLHSRALIVKPLGQRRSHTGA